MIRILLADDHAMVLSGLERLVSAEPDLSVVATARNGGDAVTLAGSTQPDVVLMDLSMPVMDGVEATRRIVEAHPGVRVVVLTSLAERERILQALDAGAAGYLMKDAEPEELLRGIRAAAQGESPLSPKAATALVAERARAKPSTGLTPREREVLALVGTGLANKQIARRLGISEKTVKAHLTSVFNQIGVTDRTQAALWAREHGLTRAASQ